MGYRFFRDSILSNQLILTPFVTGLITVIKNDRDGEPISAHLLLSSLSILSTLDLYYPDFAQNLIQSTQSYYHAEAESLSISMAPAEYIAHVDSRLRLEEQRCERFLERQSKKEVMEVVQHELITEIADDIVERGFTSLVKSHDIGSLRTLYHLLSLVKEVEVMRTAWSNYIKVSLPGPI